LDKHIKQTPYNLSQKIKNKQLTNPIVI